MTGAITVGRLAAGLGVAALGLYGAQVYRRMYQHGDVVVQTLDYDVATSFKDFQAIRRIANPRNFPLSVADTRFAEIRIPARHAGISDEKLLASFTRGFYGGMVFGVERTVANHVLPRFTILSKLTDLSALQNEAVPISATSRADLPREKVLPLYSRVCDLFQVADIHLSKSPSANESSYVDFVFGSDSTRFSGAHRFSVLRDPQDPTKATITYASVVCNPQTGEYVIPPGGAFFHRVYAMMLFKEAMAEVLGYLAQ
ncbi:hypothetical protein LIA77_08691 [Sarocladium implicatum]|nr:hypothetical protein LIA77_08691 [Sarocladium implicatum]